MLYYIYIYCLSLSGGGGLLPDIASRALKKSNVLVGFYKKLHK